MVAMLAIPSQINLIKDTFYLDIDSDNKKYYSALRKRIIASLEVCKAKLEINDQQ